MAKRPPGFIFYDGPSRIDGAPIVGIATLKTKNKKTGPMVQTWILRKNINPVRAINTGSDYSICGNCPLRGIIERTDYIGRNRGRLCYVKVPNAPNAIWGSFKRGNYPTYNRKLHKGLLIGRTLRLGAYGDPTAIPLPVWHPLLQLATGHSGYSHQWQDLRFRHWARYIMASTHTVQESATAHLLGWRTFRTRITGQELEPGEINCPASTEGGNSTDCDSCCACDGNSLYQLGAPAAPRKASISLGIHGSPAIMKNKRLPGIHA